MAIEVFPGGGMVVTGEHINLARLLALKGALKLEILGMKRRGRSAFSILKKEFGKEFGPVKDKRRMLTLLEMYIDAKYYKEMKS